MGLGQLLVAARMLALLRDRFGAELPFDLGRRAHHEAAGGHVAGDDGAGGHEGASAHGDA